MKASKAVLVFCEGSHDVIFVQRVLGQEGFRYFDGPVEQLPTPLGLRPDGPISRSYMPAGAFGLFVFCRLADGKGTLDDHLAEIIRQDGSMPLAAAGLFIDDHKSADHPVSKKPADRLKAMMTAAGQFHRPGQPLSEVISRNGPLREVAFKTDLGKKLVEFLLSVSWSGP